MTANRELAERRGISEEDCLKIDSLHEQIERLLKRANLGVWNSSVHEAIKQLEFRLQELWSFPLDEKFHRYTKEYEFKSRWIGSKWKCTKTGEVFVVPEDVYETACYYWSDAMLDVGRHGFYCRMSNCVEV